jgi:mono/diheme cytochrome c family protein
MDAEEKIILSIVGIVIIYAILNNFVIKKDLTKDQKISKIQFDKNISKNSKESLYQYIVDVINNGSSGHNFKGGQMEGGYISKEDAKIVACYVLELSGRKCPHPYPKDLASGYFSSVCAGCHGNDGKGINGTYPDLTKKNYVGF